MTRREFLAATGAAVLAQPSWAGALPRDVRITRVLSFDLHLKRSKYAGKNAVRGDHGAGADDRMLRIYTNAGIDGMGPCRAGADECKQVLGRNPFDFYQAAQQRMVSPLGRFTTPLWDLAGKALNQPVYELLGGAGPKRVRGYDGSIYFSDLLPQYAGRWRDRFKEELDAGLARGHRAFKVKVGRGHKWMPPEPGYDRDVEVLNLIRKHLGPKVTIGIDANTSYGLLRTKRLLEDLPDYNFAFVEEMFPDSVEESLELKAFIAKRGWKTLIADGENHGRPETMKPWIDARAVDILQGDMNHFGFEGILAEAAMARPARATVAPHNWGSLIGFYLQLQVGRAITNFYMAENDPLTCPALIAEGYEIKNGTSTVPDAPGLGLKINEPQLTRCCRVHFDLKEKKGAG